ncbi:MAG: Dcp1p-Dcp2p decapping enzyme complex alpha subunit [Thelocarpon impressellum]|nr:MAG: Dcp1p-Dcp2p decapping enzyme complex alpha subunit [Thelocarpon impressellum]
MAGSVPEIPGVKADAQLAQRFRREVADLLGRHSDKFAGAQPVSFAMRHIRTLQAEDYYVCEKSDGIRCLMYFAEGDGGSEIHYLIDRRNDFYYVAGLHFPVPGDPSFQNFHVGTIIDGELVNDALGDGAVQLKYLVFDCLMLDGNSLMHRTLDKRLAYFRDRVYNPYKELYARFPDEMRFLPFVVEFKKMEFSYGIEMMFRDILPNLPHGNDGLIFTCRNSAYKFGTDEHILKWKPAAENSVDFRLNLDFPLRDPDSDEAADGETSPMPDYDAMPAFRLSAYHGGSDYRPFAQMHAEPAEWERLKAMGVPLQDTIVECGQDERGRWRFLRFRPDKREANHISTVESVLESIQDRVGEADLIAAAKSIRDEWKKRQAAEQERQAAEQERRPAEQERARREAEERRRNPAAPAATGANGTPVLKRKAQD